MSGLSRKRQLEILLEHRGLKDKVERGSSQFEDFQETYRYDPFGFVRDCIIFDPGDAATPYQEEILKQLPIQKRVAVRGPHGLGKSAMAAWVALWAILTVDDVKVPTTASAWRQLSKFLWPEIHKWAVRLRWDKIGRGPFQDKVELLALSLKRSPICESFAVASNNAALIEGAHAQRIVYIYDEARTIPPETWDAAEGAFSSAGEDTGYEAFALAVSTPGEPVGRFYDIHRRASGYEDWWVRHVTKDEAINAGRMSVEWVRDRERQWGEGSDVFQSRVLGEFATGGDYAIIPLSWVEESNHRWQEWDDAGRPYLGSAHVFGLDVARYGEDKSALVERSDCAVVSIEKWGMLDTMQTAGRTKARIGSTKTNIDVIGIGSGVFDRLREQGCNVEAINFAEGTRRKDSSGEVEMLNVRAAAWWGLRERLDPMNEDSILLPPDDDLTDDLTAPRYEYTSSGALKVEAKEEIRKRLERSPDVGDAVVLAFWEPHPNRRTARDQPGKESRWGMGKKSDRRMPSGQSRWKP